MDYKYIEQLLERYWKCETTLAEEEILKAFFLQEDVPSELLPYKDLFAYEASAKADKLGDDFDAKILAKVKAPVVEVKHVTVMHRLRPLFKAAAIVAILLTLGNAAQHSFRTSDDSIDYNYDNYKDTYTDPKVAYDHVSTALKTVSEGLSQLQGDTLNAPASAGSNDVRIGAKPTKSAKE
jgi:hypothetical protein